MVNIPERISWAVDLVDPGPGERLVEIGPGVAAGLVCARLETGRLLAVDRSAVAVGRAAKRNAEHVAAGRLELRESELADLELPESSVDKVFSVNVNVFWTRSPERELAVLHAALRPGGTLFVLYGAAGPTGTDRVTPAVSDALRAGGFTDVEAVESERGTGVRGSRG